LIGKYSDWFERRGQQAQKTAPEERELARQPLSGRQVLAILAAFLGALLAVGLLNVLITAVIGHQGGEARFFLLNAVALGLFFRCLPTVLRWRRQPR
jgi:hypothetical protein